MNPEHHVSVFTTGNHPLPLPLLLNPIPPWGGLYDITASYDDVIAKNDSANFKVNSLLNLKINETLIKSYISKICT